MVEKRSTILCILDGWGLRDDVRDNAIHQANTPHYDDLLNHAHVSQLATYGIEVGLPEGQMGNSEVGHMNIGAGRIVWQDYPRINNAIETGEFAKNPQLVHFAESLKTTGGRAHLLSLCSDGGVHAHTHHVVTAANLLAAQGLEVVLHVITDGRDTPPQSALQSLQNLAQHLDSSVCIGSLSGRYFAMDRDQRWDRVEQAYRVISGQSSITSLTPEQVIQEAYAQNLSDEFIQPVQFEHHSMSKGDGLFMLNFRADRARELLEAFVDPEFKGFTRPQQIEFSGCLGMVSYSEHLNKFMSCMFAPVGLPYTLGEVVSNAGGSQLRLAETEKYAHVTFFFNGGREATFPGEERILIPSPKVATYDLKPEMSAPEVTAALTDAIRAKAFDLIVVNYANPDMVGHTGIMSAALQAVEHIDSCLGAVRAAVDETQATLLVTADHGNIEMMKDPETGAPSTSHTVGEVPFILYPRTAASHLREGRLCDIAPTILDLMDLEQPQDMTGTSLVRAV